MSLDQRPVPATQQPATQQPALTPLGMFLRVLAVIAAAEVMESLLSLLGLAGGAWEVAIDAVVLSAISAPFIYIWVVRAVQQRQRAEQALRRSLVLERAIRSIHEALIEEKGTEEIFGAVCDGVLEMGYRMCWVGLVEPDHTVRPVVSRGFEAGYLSAVRVRWDDALEGRGPVGTAIRRGEIAVLQNAERNPDFAPWREEAQRRGYRSAAAVPLKDHGQVLGVIAVYSERPDAFGADEMHTLEVFAQQATLALLSARRREALSQSESSLARAQEIAHLGNWDWEIESGRLRWSDEVFRIFGLVPGGSDVTYPMFLGAVHPDDLEFVQTSVDAALRGEKPYDIDHRILRPDGSERIVHEQAEVVFDESGRPVRMLGTAQDITERKKAEEAQARLAAILEATPDFVAIADVQGQGHLYLNRAGRSMLGIGESEDVSIRPLMEYYPEWARELLSKVAIPVALREGVWSGETAILSRAGREIPVSQVIIAHKTPDGRVEFLSTIARDISERKYFEEQLAFLADHDTLTGLFNRRRFQQELSRHLARASKRGPGGALLFLDLDNFKYVNDTFGHPAGDQLLVTLAELVQERVGESGILARLGGDEFAVLLPKAGAEQAQALAGQIAHAVGHRTLVVEGQPISITVSVGIALFPRHGKSVEELLARADLAMYRAKEDGGNRICLYSADQDQHLQMQFRLTWAALIREALEQDRFVLHLQPILDLKHGRVSQYEVLVRMVGDAGELILPGVFLDVAERSGLIRDIDRWVVRRAIRMLADQGLAGKDACLEVNLSGKAFADGELLPLIQHELAACGVNPAQLVFEITETAAIANLTEARHFITTLKSLGCGFALDDFGVGFSSFSRLKHLPVDYLKIDGNFVRDLSHNEVDQHLVKAMVEVAQRLGKQTIAESVGDAETVRLLRELGVDYAQGYHIGRPGAVDEALSRTDLAI